MSQDAKFSDLKTRLISAVLLIFVGGLAIWFGGLWFLALLVVAGGLMCCETARMHGVTGNRLTLTALLAAVGLAVALLYDTYLGVGVFGAALAVAIAPGAERRGVVVAAYILIFLAVQSLSAVRIDVGFLWTIWLSSCVIASDVGGYFAGRIFGGPKFWPAISPKKTWSGTIGGWVLALIVSAVFMQLGLGNALVLVEGVFIAMFAQAGDLAESWMKRKAGIKDSSNLIPGHGGLLDRFDGLLGAALFAGFLVLITGGLMLGGPA